MTELKIGIIDDDSSKITQIMTRLIEGWDSASQEKKTKYSEYQFVTDEMTLASNIHEIVNEIKEKKVDCVLVDYQLSSYANVGFTGVDLSNELQKHLHGFPIFILTSYEDDIYSKEIFDVYQIFNFDRYLNDTDERIELNSKIIEQILKHRKEQESWETELLHLLPKAGETVEVDSRILELDGYIENAVNGLHHISTEVKQQLTSGKIDALINKLDRLIDED